MRYALGRDVPTHDARTRDEQKRDAQQRDAQQRDAQRRDAKKHDALSHDAQNAHMHDAFCSLFLLLPLLVFLISLHHLLQRSPGRSASPASGQGQQATEPVDPAARLHSQPGPVPRERTPGRRAKAQSGQRDKRVVEERSSRLVLGEGERWGWKSW